MNSRLMVHLLAGFLSLGCADGATSSVAGLPSPHGNSGVTQGGAQDFGAFREVLERGEIPAPQLLDDVGFFAEHKLELPEANCGESVCIHARLGVMGNFVNGANCTMLFIGMNTQISSASTTRVPLNLAVAVDTSGSMLGAPLSEAQAALRLMLPELQPHDRVSLVGFSNEAVVLAADAAPDSAALRQAIDGLTAAGATNIYDGLSVAYELVQGTQSPSTQTRVILLTDGEATAGFTSSERMLNLSAGYAAEGIALSTVGFGQDFDLPLMRELAIRGTGSFYFVEDPSAIREVFVEEVRQSFVPIAKNAVLKLKAASDYNVRGFYGALHASTSRTEATVEFPLLQVAQRTSVADNELGRRGGGGILIAELTPSADAGTQAGKVSELTFEYETPAGRVVRQAVKVDSPLTPGETPERGYFNDVGVEKSFVMLNLYAGMRGALEDVSYGDTLGAVATLASLEAGVSEWNQTANDSDIQDDLRTLRLLLELVQDRVSSAPAEVAIRPRPPWTD